jgi:hypothetical protein
VLLEFGAETANIPRTAPIGEVLTLALGAGRIIKPSAAFPQRPPWSNLAMYNKIRAGAIRDLLVKSRFLLLKICKPRNSELNVYSEY